MNKNSIVLNGKRYDASTGALLGTVSDSQFRPLRHKPTKGVHAPAPQTVIKPSQPKPAQAPIATKKTTTRAHHTPKTAARNTKSSKTLMRSVVKKPLHKPHPIVKKHYPATAATSPLLTPKLSADAVDLKRLHRAKKIGQSARIGKFQDMVAPKIKPKIAPITVAEAPTAAAITPIASMKPAPHTASKHALFEQALTHAKSHEQTHHTSTKKHRSKQRRLLHSVASLTAVLVIGISIAYLNKGSVELQLASVRAGFQASTPGYQPAGFQKTSTETKDGTVAIRFTSPTSGYTLSQEASDWDSQTLFDSVVASSTNNYRTVMSGGRTIFLYGNNQAAWVDGGILYKVQGNADLSKDQISSIASSM